MTMHWEEKCKSVKRCFFKVKMVWCWWWWYFPRRGFYRLIWHEKAYAFGSEKEVIKHEHICMYLYQYYLPNSNDEYYYIHYYFGLPIFMSFENSVWVPLITGRSPLFLSILSSHPTVLVVVFFLYIPFHTIGYGLWHVVPSCGYLVMLLMTLGSSKKWWNG